MPLYEYRCPACSETTTQYRSVENRNHVPSCCGVPSERVISAPMIATDIEPYQSPVDGRVISSREQRKQDLRRHGCVEWEPGFKDHCERMQQERQAKFEADVDRTVDSIVAQMPARKIEKLVEEVRGGADAKLVRSEP